MKKTGRKRKQNRPQKLTRPPKQERDERLLLFRQRLGLPEVIDGKLLTLQDHERMIQLLDDAKWKVEDAIAMYLGLPVQETCVEMREGDDDWTHVEFSDVVDISDPALAVSQE